MRMDKLTSKLQLALADARSLAVGKDHQFIEPIHLLSAMLQQEGGSVKPLLSRVGVEIKGLNDKIQQRLNSLAEVQGQAGEVHLSQSTSRLLNVADKLAQKRGDSFISSDLFLLALVDDKDSAAKLLRDSGASKAALEKAITWLPNLCHRPVLIETNR